MLIILSHTSFSQVVINEYSASNLRMFTDDFGKYEDWIELYNKNETPVDLSGWYLSDKTNKPKKWKIPVGTIIPPKGFLVFWASGRDLVTDSSFHTNFKFTQTKKDEFVVLANPNGTIIESAPLRLTQLHHSVAKSIDGGNLWKICTEPTPGDSNMASSMYKDYASTPVISGISGFYKDSVLVTVSNNGEETIRYTLDGSIPTESSEIYSINLLINESTVLSVRSFSDDDEIYAGFTDFKTFFINEPVSSLPVISIGAGNDLMELANGDREKEPIGSCEVFSKEGLNISKSFGELDRHGQDSWVNDQRSLDWISRDEMGHDSGLKQKLFNYSDRDEYQRIILRASGDDNYPAVNDGDHEGSTHVRDEYVHCLVQKSGMQMDVRASERYLVYLNGQYWGVYAIREKPDDHDYTDYTYKQDKYDLQFLKTWGQTWVEYGEDKAIRDWENFRDYILNEDVSKPEVYSKITNELDVLSLMDYMIVNLTCVSSDWLNYNTGWWRGLNPSGGHKKWGYIMWDNDATFDYYLNYSGVPDTSPNAKACDIEDISYYMDEFFPVDTTLVELAADSFYYNGMWQYFEGDTFFVYPDAGKHEKIFLKLLDQNENFRNLYFARYADMLNTTYSCESMLFILDSMINIIRPEMPRHIKRWGGNMNEWERNVKKLRDFVSKRCARVANGLKSCYNLTGTYQITLITSPPNQADIKLNTQIHRVLPWRGNYFGNMTNSVEVLPYSGKKFLYWRSSNGKSVFNEPNLNLSKVNFSANDTLVAVFDGAVNTFDIQTLQASISPNPAYDIVHVHFSDIESGVVEYDILTSDGKVVQSHVKSINYFSFSIDVKSLNPGVYTLRMRSNKSISTSKFIVMK
jgi:hypothetical protein